MKLTEGELEFNFNNAIAGFKFDEKNTQSVYFHGLSHCMKGVDFIIELSDRYVFVEVKDPSQAGAPPERRDKFSEKVGSGWLVKELVQKYRDTFLYRWAEQKIDKPIYYICLVTLENALVLTLMSDLKRQIPEGKANARWQQSILEGCAVVNLELWNQQFKDWPVRRLENN